MRRAHRIFLTTCAVGSTVAGIAGIALYWDRRPIEGWIEHRAIEFYLRKLEPELPFQIESIEVGKETLKDLMNMRVPELKLVLRRDEWVARLSGPMDLKRSRVPEKNGKQETDVSLTYRPQILLERRTEKWGPFDSYVSARVHMKGALRHIEDLADIREAKIRVSTDQKLAWHPLGLEVEAPYIRFDWVAPGASIPSTLAQFPEAHEGTIGIQAHAKTLNWTQTENRAASVGEPAFDAEIPVDLKPDQKPPVKIGPEITFRLRAKSVDGIRDDDVVSLPPFPAQGKIQLDGLKPVSVQLSIGSEKTGIDLSAAADRSLRWSSRGTWDLSAWVAGLLKIVSGSTGQLAKLYALRGIGFKHGNLKTRGVVTLSGEGSGKLEVSGLDVDFPQAAIRGMNLELEADREQGVKGWLDITGLYFKKFQAKLGRVPFSLKPTRSGQFEVRVGQSEDLPLEVSGIPVHLGSVSGTLEPGQQYDLTTHIELPPLGIERLAGPLCIPLKRLPPAVLTLHFPEIEISNDAIDPTGEANIDLFDGKITVGDIGLFDLFSGVPETDFTLDMTGIHLDEAGNWLGLGEVDGILQGYAHDVTIQAWLPTHFDFLLEAKPHKSREIVFTPEAMENFIKLIAADAIDNMPGIVRWFMFGWPANLNKGYDVEYAGISAFSQDGNILLETLDSPEERAKGNHFILYGTRFKMPLKSAHYPPIVDNSAMSSFVRERVTYLIQLASQKRQEREGNKNENPEPEIDCVPDVLRARH